MFAPMENWIGIGVWIVLGALIGLSMMVLVKQPEQTAGHKRLLAILGAFSAVVGGMIGVGIFHFHEPLALSSGGMAGAVVLSALFTFIYRWGIRGMT